MVSAAQARQRKHFKAVAKKCKGSHNYRACMRKNL